MSEHVEGRRAKQVKLKETKHLEILSPVTEMTTKVRKMKMSKRQIGYMLTIQNFIAMRTNQIIILMISMKIVMMVLRLRT